MPVGDDNWSAMVAAALVALAGCALGTGCGSDEPSSPCAETTCRRGVCEAETGQCVSAESCTEATEVLDCVEGEKCAEGTCRGEETFCEAVSCEMGVCRFEAGGCVEATECGGDDAVCGEGRVCNDMGRCQPDLCVRREVECDGGGVCRPSTGECENAESCETNADCLTEPEHLCIEGTCRLASAACGDAGGDGGCPSNQTCEYDEQARTVDCVEPSTCETALDCLDDRQCAGRSCRAPETCRADRLEPNDTPGTATPFRTRATDNSLAASVCGGDTDLYTVDTTALGGAGSGEMLLVEIDVAERERGLGEIEVVVTGPSGSERGRASTGPRGAEGAADIATDISGSNSGLYTVAVSAGDAINPAGVDYDLSANVLSADSLRACEEATTLPVARRVSGTTLGVTSSGLGSSCTAPTNGSPERIYAIEIDEPQELTFELTPRSNDVDLTMSLRTRCAQPAAERACVDAGGPGETEEMSAVVGAGTHYLIVQAPEGAERAGGRFELSVRRLYTACASRDDYCGDGGEAHVCRIDRGEYYRVECDAGCNPSTGRCWSPAGDFCGDAPAITPASPEDREVSLDQTSDDYRLESGTCSEGATPPTEGPDMTYQLSVPAETVATIDVVFEKGTDGAMYLVEDCSDIEGTCELVAQDSTIDAYRETLTYANLSDAEETYYLVLDTGAGRPVGGAEIQVDYREVICSPGAERCDGAGHIERCGEYGLTWNDVESCRLRCDSATCLGETCGEAIRIPNASSDKGNVQSYAFPLGQLGNDHAVNGSYVCTGSANFDGTGPEAVFELAADKGDVIDIEWRPKKWGVLTVATDCSNLGSSCVAGASAQHPPIDLQFASDTAETYYIVADTEAPPVGSIRGSAELDVLVRRPQCSPGTSSGSCVGGGRLKYCTPNGVPETLSCDGGCTAGACANPSGQVCADAIALGDGASDSRGFTGRQSLSFPPGTYGDCRFSSGPDADVPHSPDHIYAIDVPAGETLSVDWETGIDESTTFEGIMYLLGTCGDVASCLANGGPYPQSQPDALTWTNGGGQQETVYLYVSTGASNTPQHDDYRVDISIN